MKIALCCICRLENRYINEFIEYYFSIGVDKIFIYDNNYDGEEHFEDVIDNKLIGDKIEIIDYRNRSYCQTSSYQDCYDKNKNEFDWFLFIDVDEFLCINGNKNIKEFLSQEKFNEFDMIHINWMIFSDNNLIHYEDKPVIERFTTPVLPLDWKKNLLIGENFHVKSIVRGGLDGVKWVLTPHTPNGVEKCCDASGKKTKAESPFQKNDYTYAYFKHFTTKTIDEWLEIKMKRGYPDGNKDFFKKNNPIKEFFKVNQVTEDKVNFIKEKGFEHLL